MLLNVLLGLVILIAVALVAVILLQQSEGGALGMGGGGSGSFMSARGTGDLLSRTTQILAGVFFTLCLLMTLLSGHARSRSSIINPNDVGRIAPSALPTQRPQEPTAPESAPQSIPAPTQTAPAPTGPAASPQDLFGPGGVAAPTKGR